MTGDTSSESLGVIDIVMLVDNDLWVTDKRKSTLL